MVPLYHKESFVCVASLAGAGERDGTGARHLVVELGAK
jgi:hypothetical protein